MSNPDGTPVEAKKTSPAVAVICSIIGIAGVGALVFLVYKWRNRDESQPFKPFKKFNISMPGRGGGAAKPKYNKLAPITITGFQPLDTINLNEKFGTGIGSGVGAEYESPKGRPQLNSTYSISTGSEPRASTFTADRSKFASAYSGFNTPAIIRKGRALYDFDPRGDDELSFSKGDMIAVTDEFTDGWGKGFILDSGDSEDKAFPLNYIGEEE